MANITYIPPKNNKAKNIKIEDRDNNFQSNDVEGALKELAESSGSGSSHTHTKADITDFAHVHSYDDLTNKPTIPVVTNDLTGTLKTNYDDAYTHSQGTHAPTNAQKNSDITKAEIEAKLTGVISSHSHEGTSNEGGNNLIAKYIHNSNKEIIVTGFDQTTGEFTWNGSPSLSIGETLYLSPTKVNGIIDLTKIPIEFFNSTTTNGIFKVYSVSGNKFTLSDSTNTKISYATQTVDTNYFKFEDFTPFNITNIDTNKVKILINAMTNKNTYDELIIDTDNEALTVGTTRLNISNKSYNVFNCEIILDLSNVFPLGFIKATIVQSRDGTDSNCRDIICGATKYDSFPKHTIVTPSTKNIITNIGMNIRSNMLNGSTVVIYDLGGE